MRLLIVDNYDSFTYNLCQSLREAGCSDITVIKNDQVDLSALAEFDKIVFSPGPGIPSEVPIMAAILERYQQSKSILGVCLGHQAIGCFYGAQLINLSQPFHGISSALTILEKDEILFRGLPADSAVGRYHSWVIDETTLPHCLKVTSKSDDGCIMSITHQQFNIRGVQFHPESYISASGVSLLQNWLG